MPIYVYECAQKHHTERVKSIMITPKQLENDTCEECGGKATLIPSRVARPVLVGSGFHENDYRHGKLGS